MCKMISLVSMLSSSLHLNWMCVRWRGKHKKKNQYVWFFVRFEISTAAFETSSFFFAFGQSNVSFVGLRNVIFDTWHIRLSSLVITFRMKRLSLMFTFRLTTFFNSSFDCSRSNCRLRWQSKQLTYRKNMRLTLLELIWGEENNSERTVLIAIRCWLND